MPHRDYLHCMHLFIIITDRSHNTITFTIIKGSLLLQYVNVFKLGCCTCFHILKYAESNGLVATLEWS